MSKKDAKWRYKCAQFDLERDFQGGAEGVVRDLQWRSEEGVVRGSAVGQALYCRAVGMLGRGFDAGAFNVCVGMEREKGSNSRLWVWVEDCGYVCSVGPRRWVGVHLSCGNVDWCGQAQ